jgi:hypothetical protein
MRTWLLIALLTAPSLVAADLPPGFRMTPGYEEVPSYHSYVQFDTHTIEELATGGRLQARKLEGRVWVMNIRPTGAQKRRSADGGVMATPFPYLQLHR